MTPREYWTACRLHDWHYEYSDDPGVFRAGTDNRYRLVKLTSDRPDLAAIFKAWEDHAFNSGPVPTEPKLED
jgi:hypothetical protein